MSNPILVTGAAGGPQGSTGRTTTNLLLDRGLPVRALVRRLDARSNGLRERAAEVVEGNLLNPTTIRSAFEGVKGTKTGHSQCCLCGFTCARLKGSRRRGEICEIE